MSVFLAGIRVIDLGQYIPGPYAAHLLAGLGAAVVKIEPPGGEPMRHLGPRDKDGLPAAYKLVNAGKTIVELDLKSAPGRAAFEALAAAADVLMESYRPGVLDRLGLGRARMEAINPRLVHTALSGWGQTGPNRLRAGHDINYMAFGGGLVASGPSERPSFGWPPVADYTGAIQAAATTLAALVARGRTGKGAFVDVSLAESVLPWQSTSITLALRSGLEPARAEGAINGGAACYNIYRTADGRFVTLGDLEAKFWANFCNALGRPDWIARQWERLPQQALIAEVAALFAGQPLAYWERLLASVDSCFEPARGFGELPDNPHITARGLLHREQDGAAEPLLQILYPAWIDGAPPEPLPLPRFIEEEEAIAAWREPVTA
jgi:crotonobetainyl-CoA:carnitine CoA-transferase CaiB-like acyl-CoA transferase